MGRWMHVQWNLDDSNQVNDVLVQRDVLTFGIFVKWHSIHCEYRLKFDRIRPLGT